MNDLDAIDARLLDLLQGDSSMSNQALSDAAHVSPATALRRVKRMVDSGLIERQTALVSLAAAGGLNAVVEITLDRQGDEHAKAFEAQVLPDEAVQQCYRVTAGPDFVLVLWVPNMPAYQSLAERLFTQNANVRTVKTYFATHRAKFNPRIPALALMPQRLP
jgi:Lrp/AsnC family transcriptional regulator, leucine-responsive regulatory protein